MEIKEELLNITNAINNIRNNDYGIGDYKMCEKESKIVIKALEEYKCDLAMQKGVKC